jgi:hypothetical protein
MSDSFPNPRRRWYQFSLRTLLIVVTFVAGFAFAWMRAIEPYRLQREAMAVIGRLGGTYKAEEATGWIRYLDRNAQDVFVVDLANCDKPDEFLPHLARLPKLRTLVLGGHQVEDQQLRAVERFPTLRGLVLDSTKVTDEGEKRFKQALPDVVVYKSERRALVELKKAAVRVSEHGGSRWLYARDIASPPPPARPPPLSPPATLRADVDDSYFVVSPPVQIYASWHGTPLPPPITDIELSWLGNLREIREINATLTQATGSFLAEMKDLSTLDFLQLIGPKVSNECFVHVSRCVNLRQLSIDQTSITDQGVAHLSSLIKLYQLDIRYSQITDESLKHIKSLSTLRVLAISHNPGITDNGLVHLKQMTGLTLLTVGGTSISKDGVEELRHALPKCRIYDNQ